MAGGHTSTHVGVGARDRDGGSGCLSARRQGVDDSGSRAVRDHGDPGRDALDPRRAGSLDSLRGQHLAPPSCLNTPGHIFP